MERWCSAEVSAGLLSHGQVSEPQTLSSCLSCACACSRSWPYSCTVALPCMQGPARMHQLLQVEAADTHASCHRHNTSEGLQLDSPFLTVEMAMEMASEELPATAWAFAMAMAVHP